MGSSQRFANFPRADKLEKLFFPCGAVAQLGERLVRNEEASGSIPLSSTNQFNSLAVFPLLLGDRLRRCLWRALPLCSGIVQRE